MVTIALNVTVPTCTYSLLCLASAPRPAPSTCPWGWVFSLDWNDDLFWQRQRQTENTEQRHYRIDGDGDAFRIQIE